MTEEGVIGLSATPMAFESAVSSYIDPDLPAANHLEAINGIVLAVGGGSKSLLDLVLVLQEGLTSSIAQERRRSALLIGEVLTKCPRLRVNWKHLDTVVSFFSERLEDWYSVEGALVTFRAILRSYRGVLIDDDRDKGQEVVKNIAQAVFSKVHGPSFAQSIRKILIEVLTLLLTEYEEEMRSFEFKLGNEVCSQIEDEKDPRNLVLTFPLLRLLLTKYEDLIGAETALVISDVTTLYFPISFTPPPNDPNQITEEMLKRELKLTLACHPRLAKEVIPFFIDSLRADSEQTCDTRNETIEALVFCCEQYGSEATRTHLPALFDFLKFEIIDNECSYRNKLIGLWRDVLRVATSGLPAGMTPPWFEELLTPSLKKVWAVMTKSGGDEQENKGKEPTPSQIKVCEELLLAAAASSPVAFFHVLTFTFDEAVQRVTVMLQQQQNKADEPTEDATTSCGRCTVDWSSIRLLLDYLSKTLGSGEALHVDAARGSSQWTYSRRLPLEGLRLQCELLRVLEREDEGSKGAVTYLQRDVKETPGGSEGDHDTIGFLVWRLIGQLAAISSTPDRHVATVVRAMLRILPLPAPPSSDAPGVCAEGGDQDSGDQEGGEDEDALFATKVAIDESCIGRLKDHMRTFVRLSSTAFLFDHDQQSAADDHFLITILTAMEGIRCSHQEVYRSLVVPVLSCLYKGFQHIYKAAAATGVTANGQAARNGGEETVVEGDEETAIKALRIGLALSKELLSSPSSGGTDDLLLASFRFFLREWVASMMQESPAAPPSAIEVLTLGQQTLTEALQRSGGSPLADGVAKQLGPSWFQQILTLPSFRPTIAKQSVSGSLSPEAERLLMSTGRLLQALVEAFETRSSPDRQAEIMSAVLELLFKPPDASSQASLHRMVLLKVVPHLFPPSLKAVPEGTAAGGMMTPLVQLCLAICFEEEGQPDEEIPNGALSTAEAQYLAELSTKDVKTDALRTIGAAVRCSSEERLTPLLERIDRELKETVHQENEEHRRHDEACHHTLERLHSGVRCYGQVTKALWIRQAAPAASPQSRKSAMRFLDGLTSLLDSSSRADPYAALAAPIAFNILCPLPLESGSDSASEVSGYVLQKVCHKAMAKLHAFLLPPQLHLAGVACVAAMLARLPIQTVVNDFPDALRLTVLNGMDLATRRVPLFPPTGSPDATPTSTGISPGPSPPAAPSDDAVDAPHSIRLAKTVSSSAKERRGEGEPPSEESQLVSEVTEGLSVRVVLLLLACLKLEQQTRPAAVRVPGPPAVDGERKGSSPVDFVNEELGSLVDGLLWVAVRGPQAGARLLAVEGLMLISQKPYLQIRKYETKVLRDLSKVLDDCRRPVRRAAAVCRSKWSCLDT
ncbi:unnamed protein product [Vitrella brassicaformis CCMP3155]|uniref:MMS19 nucleotide excision repair protein n=4 Tax=Vitrella brassicaformis TaxID=1169539 RepID=A0A0G4EFN6_VITBC|nr:unnamed protein product [Vitrella brassicaformis CCMP3155]|eukprot:CEL95283.1 unnamed protein product [Vitrella brassicaformis CCMP3155]